MENQNIENTKIDGPNIVEQNDPDIKPEKNKKRSRLSFILFLLIVAIFGLVLRYYVFQPYIVSGESMEPNFHNNEYLIVNKVNQFSEKYNRGDVVVFKNPENPKEAFLKRVIGLSGEKIEITNNQIKIYNDGSPNGMLLKEDYLSELLMPKKNPTLQTYNISENQYFLMGDNRSNSIDSRSFGPVDKNLIIGNVWVDMNGFLNFEKFSKPVY